MIKLRNKHFSLLDTGSCLTSHLSTDGSLKIMWSTSRVFITVVRLNWSVWVANTHTRHCDTIKWQTSIDCSPPQNGAGEKFSLLGQGGAEVLELVYLAQQLS
jgi:hypothetical protein